MISFVRLLILKHTTRRRRRRRRFYFKTKNRSLTRGGGKYRNRRAALPIDPKKFRRATRPVLAAVCSTVNTVESSNNRICFACS